MARNIHPISVALALLFSAICPSFGELKPNPESFTTLQGDHLEIDGHPVLFFCATGVVVPLPAFSPLDTDEARKTQWDAAAQKGKALAKTLRTAGFNMVRLSTIPPGESGVQGSLAISELYEYFIWACKEEGLRIWAEVLHPATSKPVGEPDVTCLDDPASASAWTNAVSSCTNPADLMLAAPWDPRLEVILQRRIREWARSFNPYTGMRRCDDPVFALWSFEQLWWDDINAFGTSTLPPFFSEQLTKLWNKWLYEKFSSDAELRQDMPDLDADESAELGNVRLVFTDICRTCAEKKPRTASCPRIALQRKFLINLYAVHMIRIASPFTMLGESARRSPLVISTNSRRDTLNVVSTAKFIQPFSKIKDRGEPGVMYEDGTDPSLFKFDIAAFAISNGISVVAVPWRGNPESCIFASQLFRSGREFSSTGTVDQPDLALFSGEITTNGNALVFPQSSVTISNIAFRAYPSASTTNTVPITFTNALLTVSLEALEAKEISSAETVALTIYATDIETGERLDTTCTVSFPGMQGDELCLYDISGTAILSDKAGRLFDVPFGSNVFRVEFTSNRNPLIRALK